MRALQFSKYKFSEQKIKRQLTGCLGGNALEDIVDERIEDGHRLVGDTSVWVDLLEDCR